VDVVEIVKHGNNPEGLGLGYAKTVAGMQRASRINAAFGESIWTGETLQGQSGTLSTPLPPQGWQRPMRRIVSQPPLIAPCFSSA
jgi:hypothetical protein